MAQHEKQHNDQNESKHYLNGNYYPSDYWQYVMCKYTCKSLIHTLYTTFWTQNLNSWWYQQMACVTLALLQMKMQWRDVCVAPKPTGTKIKTLTDGFDSSLLSDSMKCTVPLQSGLTWPCQTNEMSVRGSWGKWRWCRVNLPSAVERKPFFFFFSWDLRSFWKMPFLVCINWSSLYLTNAHT